MRMKRNMAFLAVSAFAWIMSGCGIQQNSDTTDDDLADVVLNEDADPAFAVLPHIIDELLVQPFPGADVDALEGNAVNCRN